jgi:hypothetical protein
MQSNLLILLMSTACLEMLGMEWDVLYDQSWEWMVAVLEQWFKDHEGIYNVPDRCKEDSENWGFVVSKQPKVMNA